MNEALALGTTDTLNTLDVSVVCTKVIGQMSRVNVFSDRLWFYQEVT